MDNTHLIDHLRAAVAGPVFTPQDNEYAAAGAGFNAALDHRALAIVVAENTADVALTVRVAAQAGVKVAVQATGHGAAGTGDDTVLISTARMTSLEIDPDTRIATVGPGTRWQQVLDAAAEYGLSGLCGSSPGVGVVGYTLGGGLGPLGRRYGYAADRVRWIEVVTADGAIRTVDTENEPELFSALLGGGAAFGIVTAMGFELVPVRNLYGGALFYPGQHARHLLQTWREWAATLPDSATTAISVKHMPPLPEVPEPLRGQTVVHVCFAFADQDVDPLEGERLIAPMRDAAPLLIDGVRVLAGNELGFIHLDPVDPMPALDRGTQLRELPEAAVDALLDVVMSVPVMMAEIRLLGGSLGQDRSWNSVPGRDAAFAVSAVGVLMPPIAEHVPAAIDAVVDTMSPWSTGGVNPNFAGTRSPRFDGRISNAWPEAVRERVEQLRAQYDPAGVFAPAARW